MKKIFSSIFPFLSSVKEKALHRAPTAGKAGNYLYSLLFKPWALLLIFSFVCADLLSLIIIEKLSPSHLVIPPAQKQQLPPSSTIPLTWNFQNNLYSWEGEVPESLRNLKNKELRDTPEKKGLKAYDFSQAVKSNLPLNLQGTIVHANPKLSIASIQRDSLRRKPFLIGEKVHSVAEVLKIKRRRVFLKNLATQALEYIEIEGSEVSSPFEKAEVSPSKLRESLSSALSTSGIKKKNDFNYEISKKTLTQQTQNLQSLLQQAQVVPHLENNQLKGFRFVYIKRGSIFEQIGFMKGDTIVKVNGQTITSSEQASEIYSSMSKDVMEGGQPVRITILRNNQEKLINYQVK